MKKFLPVIFIMICSAAFAQDSLKTFSDTRYRTTVTGLEVLGSWGLANVAAGIAGRSNSRGGSNKYFYQATLVYGAVNFGASLIGFGTAQLTRNRQLTPFENLKEQQKIERTFIINGSLDVAYIGVGVYLKAKGDSHNNAEQQGYGSSFIFQSAMLLVFDGTMYSLHRSNGNKLRRFLEKNPVTFTGREIGLIYHLN